MLPITSWAIKKLVLLSEFLKKIRRGKPNIHHPCFFRLVWGRPGREKLRGREVTLNFNQWHFANSTLLLAYKNAGRAQKRKAVFTVRTRLTRLQCQSFSSKPVSYTFIHCRKSHSQAAQVSKNCEFQQKTCTVRLQKTRIGGWER